MSGDLLSTSETYDFILSEGNLRSLLAQLETLRTQHDTPYCLRIHLEPAGPGLIRQRNIVEPLTTEAIEKLRQRGELEF